VHKLLLVHNTTQNSSDNLPSYLQTTIVAQMLFIGGEGQRKLKTTVVNISNWTYVVMYW